MTDGAEAAPGHTAEAAAAAGGGESGRELSRRCPWQGRPLPAGAAPTRPKARRGPSTVDTKPQSPQGPPLEVVLGGRATQVPSGTTEVVLGGRLSLQPAGETALMAGEG